MKKIYLLFITLFAAVVCQAQSSSSATLSTAPDTANYNIHVTWLDGQGQSNSLEVLTAEGQFSLDTLQKNSVKIDDYDVPVTLKFTGELKPFDTEKGRLKLFLGRTIPYVTSRSVGFGGKPASSYSQLSVGLDSAFNVTFGKPVTIQTDENGQIIVLVDRTEN